MWNRSKSSLRRNLLAALSIYHPKLRTSSTQSWEPYLSQLYMRNWTFRFASSSLSLSVWTSIAVGRLLLTVSPPHWSSSGSVSPDWIKWGTRPCQAQARRALLITVTFPQASHSRMVNISLSQPHEANPQAALNSKIGAKMKTQIAFQTTRYLVTNRWKNSTDQSYRVLKTVAPRQLWLRLILRLIRRGIFK